MRPSCAPWLPSWQLWTAWRSSARGCCPSCRSWCVSIHAPAPGFLGRVPAAVHAACCRQPCCLPFPGSVPQLLARAWPQPPVQVHWLAACLGLRMQSERSRCHCLQGVLSEGLRTQVEVAETVQALEDLYLPHRPKRTTKGAVRPACLMVPCLSIFLAPAEAWPFSSTKRNQWVCEQQGSCLLQIPCPWLPTLLRRAAAACSLGCARQGAGAAGRCPPRGQEGWAGQPRSSRPHFCAAARGADGGRGAGRCERWAWWPRTLYGQQGTCQQGLLRMSAQCWAIAGHH